MRKGFWEGPGRSRLAVIAVTAAALFVAGAWGSLELQQQSETPTVGWTWDEAATAI